MPETLLSIIPDKKLMPALGQEGYSFPQAISELVDNSIDSFLRMRDRSSAQITISFETNGASLSVEDNAEGMSLTQLESALRIAHTSPEHRTTLGQYGIGMKAACTALGKAFSIETATFDSDKIYSVSYVEDFWLTGKDDDWTIRVNEKPSEPNTHFTKITITDLRVKLYAYRKDQLLEHLSRRYGAYLSDGIQLQINGALVVPTEYRRVSPNQVVEKNYFVVPITKRLELGDIVIDENKKIRGWVGLLQKSSQRGYYGINLFRENRLIDEYNKELLRSRKNNLIEKYDLSVGHPGLARVVGEIHIDFVPVSFNKRQFNYESEEWKRAEVAIIENSNFRKILTESRELAQAKGRELTPEKARKLQLITTQVFATAQNKDSVGSIEDIERVLSIKDRSYLIEPKIVGMGSLDEAYHIERQGNKIIVITNSDFPAYKATKDVVFYAALNLIDAIAELQTENDSLTDFKKRRVTLLKGAAEYIKRVEASKKGF